MKWSHISQLIHHLFYSLTKFIEIRKQMGLIQTRQQGHTPESIQDAMQELRVVYPNAGAREMISLLFHEMNMCVSRSVRISIGQDYVDGLTLHVQKRHTRLLYYL